MKIKTIALAIAGSAALTTPAAAHTPLIAEHVSLADGTLGGVARVYVGINVRYARRVTLRFSGSDAATLPAGCGWGLHVVRAPVIEMHHLADTHYAWEAEVRDTPANAEFFRAYFRRDLYRLMVEAEGKGGATAAGKRLDVDPLGLCGPQS